MTALQLTLTAPGVCRGEGCDCRLSVADVGGLCVNCAFALEQAAKAKAMVRQPYPPRPADPRCAGCGAPRAFKSRRKCRTCQNAENRAYRARRRGAVGQPQTLAARGPSALRAARWRVVGE
jgi:hypothetical protein